MNTRIKLLLNWYELKGDKQIAEEELTGITITDVLTIFDAPFWNGLYHCWAIDKQQIKALQPHCRHVIQPQYHAYFLEAIKQQ